MTSDQIIALAEESISLENIGRKIVQLIWEREYLEVRDKHKKCLRKILKVEKWLRIYRSYHKRDEEYDIHAILHDHLALDGIELKARLRELRPLVHHYQHEFGKYN